MPSNIKTYDGSGDLYDHLKIFEIAAKVEQWAMPTWCHMFNSTLIRSARLWFDELPPESIHSYVELQKAFVANFLQQKKYIRDPVDIHHIKQREEESTEAFMEHFKAESMHVKGTPKCMRVSRFIHDITNLDLIKRLNDNILKSVDEIMSLTTTFLRGEVAVANQSRMKGPPSWRHHEVAHKSSFNKRPDFKNLQNPDRRHDRFIPLIKNLKEILAMDTVKFKPPPPMPGFAKNRNKNKFCEFHRDKGHSKDECIHLKKQIEEAVKSRQLLHLIKELKKGNNKGENSRDAKKGETSGKENIPAIFMVQPWQRVTRQKITQSFSTNQEISFPPLESNDGQESQMVIETEIGGHLIHCI
ncbi:reverse transcriptase domain-containing protein [Tanacetum coccineum]